MSNSSPLGIGLIGAGAMARTYCEVLSRHTTGARLIAVSGGTRAPALAADYKVAASATVEAMLERSDIGAVIIATPEMRHLEQTLQAAAKKKHVLVEKPEAKDVAPCDVMVARCAEAGVVLGVCHHWRFRSVHTRALALLRSGKLGAVRSIKNQTLVSRESSVAGFAARPFYLDPGCGGLLMGWAIHNFDWVRCLAASDPTSVSAETTPAGEWGNGRMLSKINFANGVAGEVEVDITRPGSDRYYFKTQITTERAKLDLDGYGELRIDEGSGWKTLWTQPAFNPKDDTCPIRLEGYSFMVQAFIDQATGIPTPVPADQVRSLSSGRDGRMAVALFQASQASGASRQPVRITG